MNQSQREVDVIFVDQIPQPVVDPLTVLERWLGEAKNQIGFQASAMSLATVTQTGEPDVRVVLLQSIRDGGLVFFTNMKSPKSEQMMATSKAAACFYWAAMGRQVRVRGRVQKVDETYADQYFSGRPRGAQIGAHASDQSSVIANRTVLQNKIAELESIFADTPVPRPDHWCGLCLFPTAIEFWEAGVDRLHDRMLFTTGGSRGTWAVDRLAP